MLNRRAVIAGAGTICAASSLAASAPLWNVTTSQERDFDGNIADPLGYGVRSGYLSGLHSVLVGRAGKVVQERYFRGEDDALGRPLGHVTFGPDTLHDMRSVTKSVVSLLYGIAHDRGLVPGPDASLLAQFPEYPDLAADPRRAALKIYHVLTMTLGLKPTQQIPPAERTEDGYRFLLNRPILGPPGIRWAYSGSCTALLARIITKATGKRLADFAQEMLFADLGISNFEWLKGIDGDYSAPAGLRLRPRDLARIGELVLANGMIGGKQIVSRSWLEASFRPAISAVDGMNYGWMWYLGDDSTPAAKGPQSWIGAFGNGGQSLWVMPSLDLTVVVTAGNYNSRDQSIVPFRVWREIVLPNLQSV